MPTPSSPPAALSSLVSTPSLLITPLLAQVVSPASPTYLHNLALSPDEIAYRTPPPYVAVGS